MAIVVVSDKESKQKWDKGTLSDIILLDTETGVAIAADGITYLESFDEDGNNLYEGDEGYLQDVYDDWLYMAQTGYSEFDGYTILKEIK